MNEKNWEPWKFREPWRLARYIDESANEVFPLGGAVRWSIKNLIDRQRAVQDLYEYLAGQKEGGLTKDVDRLWYSLNEYHPGEEQQPIRSPRKILEQRCGTCLDLAALFAGLCLSQRLCPLVVVTQEHAFALVALARGIEDELQGVETLFAKGPVTNAGDLLFLLDEGDESGYGPAYLPVECTGFAGIKETRGPLTFREAVAEGRKALKKALEEPDLRFVLDVTSARYLLHEPAPDCEQEPLWPDLTKKWLAQEAETIGALSRPEDLHLNEVDGPVPFWFQKLLAEKPWHEKIRDLLDGIVGPPITDPEVQKLQERLKAVDLSAGYGALLKELQAVLTRSPGTKAFWQRFSEIEKETGLANQLIPHGRRGDSDVQELQSLRDLRNSLLDLQDEVKKPSYQRCLLVAGDAGAGKTHITTALRAESPPPASPDFLLLWLKGYKEGDSIEAKILSELKSMNNDEYSWPSLRAFQRYLDRVGIELKIRGYDQSRAPALVVVLDDYERWLREGKLNQQDFQEQILATTQYRSVYWVLLVQHAALADVMPGTGTWQELAWSPDPNEIPDVPAIGPWIDLDAADRSCRLGLELIRKVTEREDPQPMDLQVEAGSPSERDLSNPRISWTFLDCRRELGPERETLASLNFIDFVSRFWESRKGRIHAAPLQPGSLDRLIQEATAAMMKLGFEPPYEDLAVEIARRARKPRRSELAKPEITKQALQILENAGFWRRVERDGTLYLQLRKEFFWSHRIAQELWKNPAARQEGDLESILKDGLPAGTGRYLQEAIAEFFLLLADGDAAAGQADRERVLGLWRQAFGSPTTASAGGLGAAKASRETQKIVAERIRGWKPPEGNPRALFALLYFLGESLGEVLPAAERISTLQPLYRAIADAGYGDYGVHVLKKALGTAATGEELLAAVGPLAGVEALKHSGEVASLVAQAAARVCAGDLERILAWLLDYARQEARRISGGPEEPQPAQEECWDGKYFIRQWIFYSALDLLLSSGERLCAADLFEKLREVSWYSPEKQEIPFEPVGFDMEFQADLVLGCWYRGERGKDQERYQDVISNLSEAEDAQDRRLAYFLIRHTRSTGGQSGLRYSSVFEPVLRRLFLDPAPEVCEVVDRFYGDFRANLGDGFQALAEERNAFHPRPAQGEGQATLVKATA